MEERTYHSLSESCELCVLHFLCWVQHKMYLLIDQNWLREMLLKKLFYIWWDFVTSLVKTIKSTFFNNKQKISTASVRKDNVASFKKQKKRNNCFVIFFDNNFVPTLMYVTLPPPRSVLICQIFHHTQLTYFATPRKQGGGKFIKVFQKGQVDVDPLPSQ